MKKIIDSVKPWRIVAIVFAILFMPNIMFCHQMTKDQYMVCRRIATDAFLLGGITELPKGYTFNTSNSTIHVYPKSMYYHGQIVGNIQNGQLVIKEDYNRTSAVIWAVILTLIEVILLIVSVKFICIVMMQEDDERHFYFKLPHRPHGRKH